MIYNNWLVTGENMENLTLREKQIVPVAAFTANGDIENLKKALNSALDNGLTLNEIKEILVQMYAYAGFPRCLNGVNAAIAVTDERSKKGIKDLTGEEPEQAPAENKYAVGKSNVEKLFGVSSAKAPYEVFAPATDVFLKEHLFCDIFERGVLTHKDREIATVSALASIKGLEPQLQAHMNGAMNTGVTEAQAREIVDIIKNTVDNSQGEIAEQVLEKVLVSRKK